MAMYSYDQVLTDVRHVYEQLTGLPAPKIDLKNPNYPLPKEGDPVALVQSEIDYLNLYLINSGISVRLSKAPTWTPSAEIYETPEKYVLNVELAGMREEDVSVQLLNNVLVVRGTRRFRRASEDAQYHTSERIYGTFERLFPIPDYVQHTPHTSFSDGILEVTFSRPGGDGGQTAQVRKSGPQKAGYEPGGEKSEKQR